MATPLAAQDKTEAPPPKVQKLFILKYADPRVVRSLVMTFGASAEPNTDLRALAVSATATQMAAIEDAITRLDTPSAAPKNVELTCYMVVGSEGTGGPSAPPLPKDLDSVITQLRNAFAFKNYWLLDVLTVRSRTGQRAETNSAGTFEHQQVFTSFHMNSISLLADGTTLHIEGMQSSIRMPVTDNAGHVSYTDLRLNSDVDIKEGQKVVVGRLGVTNGQALFVVLMAKVVN
jgi:hypothetical protein